MKTTEAQKRANAKFTRVGTKLNEAQMAIFNARLEQLNVNQSQYIRNLIKNDLLGGF